MTLITTARMGGALLVAALLTTGCGGGSSSSNVQQPGQPTNPQPVVTREHDERSFVVVEEVPADDYTLAFEALPGAKALYGKYDGIHGEAAYRMEIPDDWNGMLVMYAHGYRGEGEELTVSSPDALREWLIESGYAWAASSYSANYYDVRAGVEDTNALALKFEELAAKHGVTVTEPRKIYITGHSMGGHVTAAAIEREAYETAKNKVMYDGAVPMCGVTADEYQFEYLAHFTIAAQALAAEEDSSLALTAFPNTNFDAAKINAVLWETPPGQLSPTPGTLTPQGQKLLGIVRNLSGGPRPLFDVGFNTPYYHVVMGTGGRGGTVNGILAKNLVGNIGEIYHFDSDPALSLPEQAFNANILRFAADPDANPVREDGVRWIPVVNGEFNIPVVSLHGLGDLYVPFKHAQIYHERAEDNGSSYWLVQRALRSPGHCDFTEAEQLNAFKDMISWEQLGVKPSGDNVTDEAIISDVSYGCAHTTEDRPYMPACSSTEI